MNRILFKQQANAYEMDPGDPRFEHVRGVLRMGAGDTFDVGMVNGPVGTARIMNLSRTAMSIAVEWGETPPLPPRVHLLVGLCRPATARKILTTAPTLGVRSIAVARAGRSDCAYAESKLWKSGEWLDLLIKGTEQAFDTHVPQLHLCDGLEEAFETLPADTSQLLALDVYEGSRALTSVKISPSETVCLAIGPERGWNASDRNCLLEAGFQLVSLNDRVLRVETAVAVGLTIVLSALGIY